MSREPGKTPSRRKAVPRKKTGATQSVGRGTRRLLDAIIHMDRQFRLGRCLSLETLATELEASERTIHRYLQFLRDSVEAPIELDSERGGYRYTNDAFVVPALTLTEGEVLALYVAGPVVARFRGTPFEAQFQSAFDKIARYLPDRARAGLTAVADAVGVDVRDIAGPEAMARFERLVEATLGERSLRIRYFSAYRDAEGERCVDPYAVHSIGGEWYLFAFCHLRHQVRTFRVDRIREVAETGESFARPDFSVHEYLGSSFGVFKGGAPGACEPIVLRFDAIGTSHVRDTVVHVSQEFRTLDDGRLEVRMHAPVTIDLVRFILGWGEHVAVLAPESLRNRVSDILRTALNNY